MILRAGVIFDVIYRNFEYPEWRQWLNATWRARSEIAGTEGDPLPRLFAAMKSARVTDVLNTAAAIADLKRVLLEAKNEMTPFRLPIQLRSALSLFG